jgi:hypothetical protein
MEIAKQTDRTTKQIESGMEIAKQTDRKTKQQNS